MTASSTPPSPSWASDPHHALWLPYTQMKTARPSLPVVAADGVRLQLADGRVLIDGMANWWTAAHGLNAPHVVAAVKAQADKFSHVMLGGLVHEGAVRLAQRLVAMSPGDLNHVFFSDSGSVAVEVALKMALQYWLNKGQPQKRRFLAFRKGYHGDTAGAMSVCDPDDGMHTIFKGHVTQQLFADVPRGPAAHRAFDAMVAAHAHELAGIIIEPLVQGAGGMRFHDPADLAAVAESARRHDVLFICDEIFTGFARTGSMFAVDQAKVVPDILCLGKALSGGVLTLAATLARPHVFEAFWGDSAAQALMHGPTYMANALACAAAIASLDLFETEPRVAQAQAIAHQLRAELMPLKSLPWVRDVRVMGAIGVVEVDNLGDPGALRARFADEGVWLRPFGDIIYTTPALTIGPKDLSRLTAAMVRVVRDGLGGTDNSGEVGP